MPIFHYQGVGSDGIQQAGSIDAASRQEALQKLVADHIQPTSLVAGLESKIVSSQDFKLAAPAFGALPSKRYEGGGVILTHRQIISFTDELADFLDSGLHLEGALQLLESQEGNSPKSQVAALLRAAVREGTTFSAALRHSSPSFGELYCHVVEAGEISGTLIALLRRQLHYLQSVEELKQRIQMALIYPAFLLGAAALAISVFIIFLIPQLSGLLAQTGGTLPLPTLILLKMGRLLHFYGLEILLSVVGGICYFYWAVSRPGGKRGWDRFKLRIPLWGPLLDQAFQAQFCQTLSNLLQNGVPLHGALNLMSGSLANERHQEVVKQILVELGEGNSFTVAMKNTGYFPSTLRDLIKVGEQTGDLGGCLAKVGLRYDKMIQQQIEKIMSLVQPIIVVGMGLMVFLIAWSMMSGIFDAMQSLQHRS